MTRLHSSTPRADGFTMPAEWAEHCRTWMLWPERPDNWRLNAAPAQKIFAAVASAISTFEPLIMGVSASQRETARRMLPPTVQVIELSANDSWMRDCGPTFVTNNNGTIRLVDWEFNAWGGLFNGLYAPWDLDDAVPQKIAELEGCDRYRAPFVLEGGSIHVDGEGTCLTTSECLLNPGRNPNLQKNQIENYLKDYLNVGKVLWVPRGVFHDETTGHVDNMVCFLQPGVLALTWTDDKSDPQYERSVEAYNYLLSITDARGRKYEIHKIHQPEPILVTEEEAASVVPMKGTKPRQPGDRMAASYINFYLCNGGAMVPTFGDPNDARALETLQNLMPQRKIVGIPAREILLGGGNIHCITLQQPKA